jgi:hypothetical protein
MASEAKWVPEILTGADSLAPTWPVLAQKNREVLTRKTRTSRLKQISNDSAFVGLLPSKRGGLDGIIP